jgi:hypothetical protein
MKSIKNTHPTNISLIIKDGAIYTSSVATPEGFNGGGVIVEPVYKSSLKRESFVNLLEKYLKSPRIEVTKEEYIDIVKDYRNKKKKDPLHEATNSKSDKELRKNSGFYSIVWSKDCVVVHLHETDDKGRPAADTIHSPIVIFNSDTPLEALAEIILEDVKQFPNIKT